ncbi:MAG: NAD(+) synthase [Candidatus Nomurabacteria bacterium]|nr:NAD(+) synthase [Candidatus Nomurabacteria bacterium]
MKNTKTYNFIRVATITPTLNIGNVLENTKICIKAILEANKKNSSLIVLPELALTGYTAGDLFHNDTLYKNVEEALALIGEKTKNIEATILIGSPIRTVHGMINAGIVYNRGKIIGVIPKLHLPNYKEFYEKRWFISGYELPEKTIKINGVNIPCNSNILFTDKNNPNIVMGAEICEDVWMPIAPSAVLALQGANILVNLSASNELVGKAAYRKELVSMQSAKTVSAYIYVSCGVHESTTDVVFSGHSLIAENGTMIAESPRFSRETVITYGDIDVDHLVTDRTRTNSFTDNQKIIDKKEVQIVETNIPTIEKIEYRNISPTPFLPGDIEKRKQVTDDIFNIQVAGLAKRLESSKIKKVVLGLSGGLDSTLTFLVALKVFDLLKLPRKNIYTITMPGFGTTSGTKNNAHELAKVSGVNIEEISIIPAIDQHFKDLGHDDKVENIVFENSQARYRTMILFDKANQVGGLVLGTGDLSESALGWCTFNGDHISNYNVNCSIPKTLVKYVVEHVADNSEEKMKTVLEDILNTPISPELTRVKNDKVTQKTEDLVGPYILHDFFIYHFIRWGSSPEKIFAIAKIAFKGQYNEVTIKKWLKEFINRFFKNQWKRSVMADGPKVGSVSLSPRGDWRMPSDADVTEWLKELE